VTLLPALTEFTAEELATRLSLPVFRGRQMLAWVGRGADSFADMTDLPLELRQTLPARLRVLSSRISEAIRSADGTKKLLVSMEDESLVECVIIPEGKRLTLCISSQVGCPAACSFCASGLLGLTRSLKANEILEQFFHAARVAGGAENITNVVMMGMGEPLLNYDHVVSAVRGLPLSQRRITLSTVGIPKAMARLAKEGIKVNLAVSLHAPNDEIRNRLVPVNKNFGIERVVRAAREYFEATRRDVTFEYILIEGENAGDEHAYQLIRLLGRGNINVNLIPMNPVEGLPYQPPTPERVETFCEMLERAGIPTHVRRPRGREIDAACGQLRLRRLSS
jgi:23S rRNA (adenine2503-C2)-methyltransferase